MSFGQLVIGPPGSGKTTYCDAMSKLMRDLGRKVAIINIDPANESKNYTAAVDIAELITLDDVMDSLKLGPNGALMYCMEFLEKNLDWLKKKISFFPNHYFLFDCPGQIELYTHHSSVRNIIKHFVENLNIHMCVVQLMDSHYCSNAGKFIAAVLMALSSMLHMEMPQINLLSKIDLAEKHNHKLDFSIDFYTEVLNLNYFLEILNEDFITKKYSKLNKAIISLVEDYSLVSFLPLNVRDKKSLLKVQREADKANGYVFGTDEDRNIQGMLACAAGVEYEDETLIHFGERKTNLMHEGNMDLNEDLLWK